MIVPLTPIEVAATRRGPKRVFVQVNDATNASLQVATSYDIAGAWVVSFKVSNDGANAFNFPAGAITLNAAGVTASQSLGGFGWVCVEVSTDGTAGTVTPTITLTNVNK